MSKSWTKKKKKALQMADLIQDEGGILEAL